MDKVALKLRLNPELVKKLKELHPSYGELSRVAGELLEAYVKAKERRPPTPIYYDPVHEEAIKIRGL